MGAETDIALYLKTISLEIKRLTLALNKIEAELHDMKLVLAEKLEKSEEEGSKYTYV